MKRLIILFCILFALPAFSSELKKVKFNIKSPKDFSHRIPLFKKSMDYPTQVIRNLEGNIPSNMQITCNEVFDKVKKFSIPQHPDFFLALSGSCSFDENNFAKSFSFNGYFNPMSDEAITYLKQFLNEHNGQEILGTTLQIENSRSTVLSLALTLGMRVTENNGHNNNDEVNPFKLLRTDLVDKTYYSEKRNMVVELFEEVNNDLFSKNRKLVKSFLDKWFPEDADYIVHKLHEVNEIQVSIQPTFLMDEGVYIPNAGIAHYFLHCDKNDNGKKFCL